MKKTKATQINRIGTGSEDRKPIRINRHFTLVSYPDYLDPQRFVSTFRDVSRKLPLAARRKIAAYRRKKGGVLRLAEDLNGETTPAAVADIRHERHLSFLDACLLLPQQVLEHTIAHELAHLYQYATQDNTSVYEKEEEVDEMVRDWFGIEDDYDWWITEGEIWMRYVLRMFEGVRADDFATLRRVLSHYLDRRDAELGSE